MLGWLMTCLCASLGFKSKVREKESWGLVGLKSFLFLRVGCVGYNNNVRGRCAKRANINNNSGKSSVRNAKIITEWLACREGNFTERRFNVGLVDGREGGVFGYWLDELSKNFGE